MVDQEGMALVGMQNVTRSGFWNSIPQVQGCVEKMMKEEGGLEAL